MSVTQDLGHVGVGVDDLACLGVQNENPIPGCFKEPAVTDLGIAESRFHLTAFADILDSEQDQLGGVTFRREAVGVDLHDLGADVGKVMSDEKLPNGGLLLGG